MLSPLRAISYQLSATGCQLSPCGWPGAWGNRPTGNGTDSWRL